MVNCAPASSPPKKPTCVLIRSDTSDEVLEDTIRHAVWNKELKHYIGDKRFKRANRSMSMIGG